MPAIRESRTVSEPSRGSPALIVLLSGLVALGPISTDLYLPSLPILAATFETTVPTVQLTLGVFLAGFAGAMLVYGPISDRFGRRPAVLGALALYLGASIGCALAPSIEALIFWRFLQSLGAAGGPVAARAIIRDLYEPTKAAEVLAYTTMVMALAPIVGPILGGVLTQWLGWQANFWVLTAAAAALLAATAVMLEETNRHPNPSATRLGYLLTSYGTLLAHRSFVGYMLVTAFVSSGIFIFIFSSAFILIDGLGLSPQAFGFAFGAVVIGYAAGSFGATRLTRRQGIDQTIRLGMIVAGLAGLLLLGLALARPPTVAAVVGPYVLFMISAGLILPGAIAGGIGPFPDRAGAASALIGFTQMTVSALAGTIMGRFGDETALSLAVMLLLSCLAAATAFATLIDRGRVQQTLRRTD